MLFEDWTQNPVPAFRDLCRFLDIDDQLALPTFQVHNAGPANELPLGLDDQTKSFAQAAFADSFDALEALIQLDLSSWKW